MSRKRLQLVAAAMVVGPLAIGGQPASAAATQIDDINGDGVVDTVVVVTRSGGGALEVILSGAARQIINQADLTDADVELGRFNSLARGDLDADGFGDVVVGGSASPANEESDPLDSIFVLYGSASGLNLDRTVELVSEQQGDQLGASIAILSGAIAVGAPSHDVGSQDDSGAVYFYGLTNGQPGLPIIYTQDSAGVPGDAEGEDYFGHALAASGDTLIVGAPGESVGSVSSAGAANLLDFNVAGQLVSATSFSQRSAGIPGAAEQNDALGESVAALGDLFVAGVPGETIGKKNVVGLIQPVKRVPNGSITPMPSVHQGTAGVPGANESGDYFGSTVAMIRTGPAQRAVAVGAPGENLGSAWDAGSVTVVGLEGGFANRVVNQGTQASPGVVPGVRTPNFRLGGALATQVTAAGGPDRLVIGAAAAWPEDAFVSAVAAPYTSTQVTYTKSLNNIVAWGFVIR